MKDLSCDKKGSIFFLKVSIFLKRKCTVRLPRLVYVSGHVSFSFKIFLLYIFDRHALKKYAASETEQLNLYNSS